MKIPLHGCLILMTMLSAHGQLALTIRQPTPNTITGSPLAVTVSTDSIYEVSKVTASLGGRVFPLTFSQSAYLGGTAGYRPGWDGKIHLDGFPKGELQLSVTAEDVLGNTDTEEVSFVYDELPVLTIHEPVEFSVARPEIRIHLECTDDGEEPCQIKVEVPGSQNPPPIETTESQLDTFMDLSFFDHNIVKLRFQATDSTGRVVVEERHVLVESSPRLAPLQRIPGRILQMTSDRVLMTHSPDDHIYSLEVFDRKTGESMLLFDDADGEIYRAYLTPEGVIFTRRSFADNQWSVVEVRGSEVFRLGTPLQRDSLNATGPFAAWVTHEETLVRRNLLTGSNTEIDTGVWGTPSLTAEGVISYATNEEKVFLFKEGISVEIGQGDARQKRNPQTDGQNVVYGKHSPLSKDGEPSAIALYDGTGETIVSTLEEQDSLNPPQDYTIEGEWVAYKKSGNSGQYQVWALKVGEQPSQRSFFAQTSWLIALNDRGELIFQNGETKYVSNPNGTFYRLEQINGDILWLDDGWKVILGRTLFALDTSEAPLLGRQIVSKDQDGHYYLHLESGTDGTMTLQTTDNLRQWSDVRSIHPDEEGIDLGDLDLAGPSAFFRVVKK